MAAPGLCIVIDSVGSLPVELNDHPHAAVLRRAFQGRASGRVHRAEPLPPLGSVGPPYGLVQLSLDDASLKQLPPGGERITRGALCLVGGSSDLFISLARNGEHDGWCDGACACSFQQGRLACFEASKAIDSSQMHIMCAHHLSL